MSEISVSHVSAATSDRAARVRADAATVTAAEDRSRPTPARQPEVTTTFSESTLRERLDAGLSLRDALTPDPDPAGPRNVNDPPDASGLSPTDPRRSRTLADWISTAGRTARAAPRDAHYRASNGPITLYARAYDVSQPADGDTAATCATPPAPSPAATRNEADRQAEILRILGDHSPFPRPSPREPGSLVLASGVAIRRPNFSRTGPPVELKLTTYEVRWGGKTAPLSGRAGDLIVVSMPQTPSNERLVVRASTDVGQITFGLQIPQGRGLDSIRHVPGSKERNGTAQRASIDRFSLDPDRQLYAVIVADTDYRNLVVDVSSRRDQRRSRA